MIVRLCYLPRILVVNNHTLYIFLVIDNVYLGIYLLSRLISMFVIEFQGMDRLFDRRGFLKKDAKGEEVQQLLDLPSGSDDDNLSDLYDSDDDPTINPNILDAYTSSESDTPADEGTAFASTSQAASTEHTTHRVIPPNAHNNSKTIDGAQQTHQVNHKPNSAKSRIKRPQCTWKRKELFLGDEEKLFKGNLDYPDIITNLETPYQFFKYFFREELIQRIVDESILYTSQKDPAKPFIITNSDLQKYLGICLLTSVTHNDNIRDFWSDTIGLDLVKNTMSINTFERIRASLHFNDNDKQIPRGEPGHDKLHKLRPVIDSLLGTFSSVRMEECLSIDEQMCSTKVRHHLRQYVQNKPHKWGYKLFVLCSTSGFAYEFEIYSGQENDPDSRLPGEPDLGASSNVVVRLSRDIPKHVNHKLYFDNYYTSVPLLVYLHQQGILSLGTARRNRIPDCKLPTEQELSKLPRGTSEEFVANVDGVEVSSVIWKDNKCVIFLSTFSGKQPETKVKRYERSSKTHKEVDCPQIVIVYNRHMGGVDLMDSHLGRHYITLRSKKWYFRLFYHLLDLAVINAWILYKEILLKKNPKGKILNQKHFRIEVAKCLCSMGRNGQKRGRPSNEIQQQLDTRKKKCPRAVVPPKDLRQDATDHWPKWNSNRNRCKFPGCKGFTFVSCKKCDVFLCFNKDKDCYNAFHQ